MRRGPFAYRKGTVYAFGMSTGMRPALIHAIQDRSRLAPHGPVARERVDQGALIRAAGAARRYLADRTPGVGGGGAYVVETTPEKYVVEISAEHEGHRDIWILAVDRETFDVEFVGETGEEP